jgi:putative zinc finger/helix-turn-helix YgiT family protein
MIMILGSNQQAATARKKALRCGNCGSPNVSTSMETDRFVHGVGGDAAELSVEVPVRTCRDCGTQFTDDEAERVRHEAVCRHLGLLTPCEIRDIRIRYGKRRPDFAALTKLGEATLARWESGATLQNAAYDQYLRLLRFPENLSRVSGSAAHEGDRVLPPNVVPFPTPRLRALVKVPQELETAQRTFRLQL